MPEAARLSHRQNRDVHHVRERVVVVVPQRRQRQQSACGSVKRPVRARRPSSSRRSHRRAARSRRCSRRCRPLTRHRHRPGGTWRCRSPRSDRRRQVRPKPVRRGCGGVRETLRPSFAEASGTLIAAMNALSSSMDIPRSMMTRSTPSCFSRRTKPAWPSPLAIGTSPTMISSCTMPMTIDGSTLVQLFDRRRERCHIASHDRVIGCVELAGSDRGGKAAEHFLCERRAGERHRLPPPRVPSAAVVRCARAAARTPRDPDATASSRTPTASGGADSRQRGGRGIAQRRRAPGRPPLAPVQRFSEWIDAFRILQGAERFDRPKVQVGQRAAVVDMSEDVGEQRGTPLVA